MTQAAPFSLREETPEAGTFVIAIDGDADMNTAMKFNESFFSAVRTGNRRVIADLTGVTFIDTTMLNALVVSHRRMARDEGCFAIVCPGSRVHRVFEITGLGQILDVFRTRGDALEHVRQPPG